MRHNKSGRKLGRTWEHRKALFRNMAKSLLTHGRIRTTESKAKELRKVADKLVTLALRNDLHAKRQAFKVLGDHSLVNKLFDEVGPRFAGVAGGYTRVVKMGLPRRGDCAPMAFIEFTRQPGEQAPEPQAKKAAPETVASATAVTEPQTTAQEPAAETPTADEPAAEAAVAEPAAAEEATAAEAVEEKAEAAAAEPATELPAEEPAAEQAEAAPEASAEQSADQQEPPADEQQTKKE